MNGGAKTWYFPDGYLPEQKGEGNMESHEALMLFNTNLQAANVKLDIYFEGRPPIKDINIVVEAERIRALRMDHPDDIGGFRLPPLTQYALRIRSDLPVVAQFGRLDVTQPNLSYYVGPGYNCD